MKIWVTIIWVYAAEVIIQIWKLFRLTTSFHPTRLWKPVLLIGFPNFLQDSIFGLCEEVVSSVIRNLRNIHQTGHTYRQPFLDALVNNEHKSWMIDKTAFKSHLQIQNNYCFLSSSKNIILGMKFKMSGNLEIDFFFLNKYIMQMTREFWGFALAVHDQIWRQHRACWLEFKRSWLFQENVLLLTTMSLKQCVRTHHNE